RDWSSDVCSSDLITEDVQYGIELGLVQAAVGLYMGFVLPSGEAGKLSLDRHGAAVIRAIGQIGFEQTGVAGNEAGAQTGQVGALGQAVKHHAAGKVRASQTGTGLQQADQVGRASCR